MARGGEAAHVDADLGEDHLGGGAADPGGLIQPVGRRRERDKLLFDPAVQLGDVGAGLVDAAKHRFQQEPVMVTEAAAEGLLQLAALGPQLQAFGTRLTALEGQVGALNTNLVEVNNRLATIEDDLGKALEGAALAAAVKDALPNPGDRFALRFNAAGASGEFAGAVGFSYNVAERTRVHINYGRSASENAVSGGVNLSFR